MNESPLLSVVIANYNYGRYLEEAIRSVLCQSCKDFELIICDGGSTDDSLEIISHYRNSIAWWCSEPDGGQSAAFNKGFAHAGGRFLTWLNADDIMLPGTVALLERYLGQNPKVRWMTGGTLYWSRETGRVVDSSVLLTNWAKSIFGSPSWIRIDAPSSFFAKDLFVKSGGFDEKLHYVMDLDLWLKFMQLGESVVHLPHYIWGFGLHTDSKTSSALTERNRVPAFEAERRLIRQKYGITPAAERIALFCKRMSCVLDGGYIRRYGNKGRTMAEFGRGE